MSCLVCHRAVSARAKKCSVCGAPTALGKGDFLFEMDATDKNQLKKYYEQGQTHEEEQGLATQKQQASEKSSASTTSLSRPTSTAASSTYAYNSGSDKGIRDRIADFISKNDIECLSGCAWASFAFGLIGAFWWPPALIFCIILLLFSVYLMAAELFYSDEPVFWVCATVGLIAIIGAGICGRYISDHTFTRVVEVVSGIEEEAQKYGFEVGAQLTHFKNQLFFSVASSVSLALPALNLLIVNYENKGTTKSRVWMFVGYAVFLLCAGFAAYSFGEFVFAKNVINEYLASMGI